MIKIIRNEKGIALVVALMVLIMLTLIGMAAILTTTTEVNIAGNEKQATQALYLAEAGISRVKAFFEDPASFNPPGGATGGEIECLGTDGTVNNGNCTVAHHTITAGTCNNTWLECFFDRRRTDAVDAPSYISTNGSQFLDINNALPLDSNNLNDENSGVPTSTDRNPGFNNADRPAMKIISNAYINDTLLDGPDPDTIGDFRSIGTIQSIEIYPPLNATNFAVVRVTAEAGGATRIVEQEIGPSNNFSVANGLSVQGAAGWNGNGSVHWGPVISAGNITAGQNSVHCDDATGAVCGFADMGGYDPWWSLDATGTIDITGLTPPYQPNYNINPGSLKTPQTLSSTQKDELKKYSQDTGQYYVYCSIDGLLHKGNSSGMPTGAGDSFQNLTNGKSHDMMYVDIGAISPSCNPTTPAAPTFSVGGGGGYYTNSNIILNGTFSISGSGGTTDITAQNPGQVDAEQPGTKTLGVHFNGLLYTTGNFDSGGNPVVYGAVIAEGGFIGSGTPDIWYNRNLVNGLPGLAWTSKQTWREIRQ